MSTVTATTPEVTSALNLNEPMDFDTLVKYKDELVELARKTKMKYEVPIKFRDQEHYVAVAQNICETVSKNINDWGFTDMIISKLKDGNHSMGVTASLMIFRDMPEDFDANAYGMYLSLL